MFGSKCQRESRSGLKKKHSNELEANPNPYGKNSSPQNQSPQQLSIAQFSGPIPPPQFLEHYERLVPGTAKRFLDEPHIEAKHRRSLQKMMVEEDTRLRKRGQYFAFSVALLSILGAFTLIILGYDVAGLGVFILSLASLVGVFIYAKFYAPKNNEA